MGNNLELAVVTLECTYCDEKPTLTFNGVPYFASKFKGFDNYSIAKAFKAPIALGLHKFGVCSYKGKLKLVYISPA